MQTKLTLRVDERLIKAAKKYSKAHGKSLSQLVAGYFLLVTRIEHAPNEKETIPPLTRALKGILRGQKEDKKEYRKHLEEKYR